MRLTIYTNGLVFNSSSNSDMSAEKAKTLFYAQFERMNKLEMTLEDGSFLMIGEEALKNAVLVFRDD